jgi:hypothetical protein
MGEVRMSGRAAAIIERCKNGQRLCKSFRFKESGDTEIIFFFEPSGKRAGPKSAQEAIATGLLKPLNDGLFDASQTWTAP